MLNISKNEYDMVVSFIEEHCGIALDSTKEYLIRSRLSNLVQESDCPTFFDFIQKATKDRSGQLREKIIDAMTTNETLWFRDQYAWDYIKEKAVPWLYDNIEKSGRVRIWSMAVSTGQEIYSLVMLIDEYLKELNRTDLWENIEIFATDISQTALLCATNGEYDTTAMSRGLPDTKKTRYFIKAGSSWTFDPMLKSRVCFKQFNLLDDFTPFGTFDMILCRHVAIYFSEKFKRILYSKIASILRPNGILLLGGTESLSYYSDDFEVVLANNSIVNIRK